MPLSHSKSKVCFFFQEVRISLDNRGLLKKYVESVFRRYNRKLGSLNYIFCTDKALLEINRNYLDHDYFTDIITFNLSESQEIKGEIYISTDRVRENARVLGVSFRSEIHRVIFHGALHLCGLNDKSNKEKEEMTKAEDLLLKKYFK